MSERPLPRTPWELAQHREEVVARLVYIRRIVAEVTFIAVLLLVLVGLACFLTLAFGDR